MGDGQINSVDLRWEWVRLQSFSNVEGNESVSFLLLAKDGFYHTGHTNLVKCYFCGFEWSDWSNGSIPDHCVERNQNIPVHSHRENSLLVPSGQSLLPHSATDFNHIIRHQRFREGTRVTDYYRPNYAEQLNSGRNGQNEEPCSCKRYSEKIERNRNQPTGGQNEEQSKCIKDTAVDLEIEGSAESTPAECTKDSNETWNSTESNDRNENGRSKPCITRTSTTPIGPHCTTRNRRTSVNHTVVSPNSCSEKSQVSTEPCRNSENVTLHQGASPPLPQLGKRVNKCPGVPQVYRDRLATFQGVSLPQPADFLAANGFYYIGSSVAVKCAYCGEMWHIIGSRQTSDTVHRPDCKFHSTQEVSNSCETSSQPNSMSDNDVSSLPAVQQVKQIGFHTPDIVNAYREISSDNINFRWITRRDILGYLFEDDNDDETSDEDGSGCTCCMCLREVISEMYFPCRHGCCCGCKSRVLRHCPKCDAIIKSKFAIYT